MLKVFIRYCIIGINSFMINNSLIYCSFFAFIWEVSQKTLLFKSFTGLTIKEYDEITKRYVKHKIKRLSKEKGLKRERKIGAGRHFTLDTRDRFLMLLVYYRLYITYTLVGFLFDLDQSNICRDIQKIERLIIQSLLIPQKLFNKTETSNLKWSGKIFSWISCFYRLYRVTNSKPRR